MKDTLQVESDFHPFSNDKHATSQHETAIPALKLTRSNSIIPQQLLADTGSGGRERAALATVFGVPEYSESKILWERQETEEDLPQDNYNGYRKSRNKGYPPLPSSSSSIYSSTQKQPQSTFTALPTIPTVSRFNDLLIRDEFGSDLMFPSNASSGLLPSSMRPTLDRSDSSDSTMDSTFTTPITTHTMKAGPTQACNIDNDNDNDQISTPLIFIDYPPTVFDLLKPDDDDRIIIWGPDPKIMSSQTQDLSSSSNSNNASSFVPPGDRPFMRGFSSNTTTSVTSSTSRHDQGLPRILTGKLTDGLRKTLKSNSLAHHSSADSLKTILLLKRAFGANNKFKQRRYLDSVSLSGSIDQVNNDTTINRVIEAASVEKLVEKLTNTLDYEFMTDFFLTYRSFISPTQLCKLFILRFRWALENDNEDRRIVRIRTFVVMRHWLLNYFVHDFIPTRNLRVVLTTFLNALPSHPLVKSSPRDQRIVKGLKRVVRRLKRVYYNGTNSQERVHVISPPPPSQDQGHIEEMVRANLAQGLLGRKTALVRGVDVGGQHNGNMAVQDATRAPMVVVGNLHHKTDFQQLQTQQQDYLSTTMEHGDTPLVSSGNRNSMDIKILGDIQLSQEMDDSLVTSQESMVSDDSLESILSPGTTEIASDENYFDDDAGTLNSDELYQDEDSGLSLPSHVRRADRQQSKLERERRRREEEEERKRAEFFSTSIDNNDHVVENDDVKLDANLEVIPDIDTPFELDDLAPPTMDTANNQHPLEENYTRRAMDLSEDHAAALTALERIDGPIRKAAIGDTSSRIRRVPSRKWCQETVDETLNHNPPQLPTKALHEDFIRQLDLDQTTHTSTDGANGLSRRLSRKSLERRKSEKGPREQVVLGSTKKSTSTPNSPQLHASMGDETPEIPPFPDRVISEPAAVSHGLAGRPLIDRSRSPAANLPANIDDFEAIPYEKTVSQPSISESTTTRTGHRRGLSKIFVNMVFSRSTPNANIDKTPIIHDSNATTKLPTTALSPTAFVASPLSSTVTPPSDKSTNNDNTASLTSSADCVTLPTKNKSSSLPPPPPPPPPQKTSTLVSRIAQELHDIHNKFEIQCDCVRCTGLTTGPRACRRFSLALLTDDGKQYSMELHHRRGASVDKGYRKLSGQNRVGRAQNGPMYLGHLGGANSDSDIDLQIEEIKEDDGSDASSTTSYAINTRRPSSAFTRLQHSHFSNGSLDRLTGIATKGAGTSIHRQSFSGQSMAFTLPMDDTPLRHSLSETLPLQPRLDLPPAPSVSHSLSWKPALKADETATLLDETLKIHEPALGSFILSYSSVKMAQQLCFIERDVLLGVDWEEMVHCRWTKMETNEDTTRNNTSSHQEKKDNTRIHLAQDLHDKQEGYGGIEQVIERFNTVCQWVSSEIVSAEKLEVRVKVVEKFIRLAQKCRMYSNFATLVQILLGLQSPSISRLKRTWARVGAREQRLLDELSQFTSPMRNWKHIRDNMTMVADEYGMSPMEVQVEMPGTGTKGFKRTKVKIPFGGCIPFLGIYLSDLVFNSEQPPYLEPPAQSTPTTTPSISPVLAQPLVNFRKHRITATVIKRVLTFQNLSRRYAFDEDEEVYAWCLLLNPLDTETIRRLSYAIE